MKKEITLPVEMLVRFAEDNRKDEAEAKANGNDRMAYFHEARAMVYEDLVKVWAN